MLESPLPMYRSCIRAVSVTIGDILSPIHRYWAARALARKPAVYDFPPIFEFFPSILEHLGILRLFSAPIW